VEERDVRGRWWRGGVKAVVAARVVRRVSVANFIVG
jgi:hypothetical protein